MAESPTREQVLAEKSDIETLVENNSANLELSDYIAKALAQVKRDIEDKKDIEWKWVYNETTSDYFVNDDGEAKNKDRLHNAIILLTVAYVFKDYSEAVGDSKWWDLYLAYRSDYDMAIQDMKLDVDWDESGAIDTGEERNTTQVFLTR